MSWYVFMASDSKLKSVSNSKCLWDGELEINPSSLLGTGHGVRSYGYIDNFTKREYISSINFYYTHERAQQLISYIADHLETSDKIELWSILLDDTEDVPVEFIRCKLNDLAEAHIENFLRDRWRDSESGHRIFVPICLEIEKS